MRKKYLSALLFGALVMASTATFTSCKDYDDDIDNLQEQINSNASAIKALQDKVNAGKWITDLSSVAGGFKVTFSDGQSFTIVNGKDGANGAAGVDGAAGVAGADGTKVTIGEDGYWYLDGEKTEYKAVADESAQMKAPFLGEDGFLYFYEDGSEEPVKSDIYNGAGVFAIMTDNVVTLYTFDEKGNLVEIKAPTAENTLASLDIRNAGLVNGINLAWATISEKVASDVAKNKTTWRGEAIVAGTFLTGQLPTSTVTVTPMSYDLSEQELALVDVDGNQAPVIITATANENNGTVDRAASVDGTWTLSYAYDETITVDNIATAFTKKVNGVDKNLTYALTVNGERVTGYNFVIDTQTKSQSDNNTAASGIAVKNTTIATGGEAIALKDGSKIADCYLTFEGANKAKAEVWGITADGMTVNAPASAKGQEITATLYTLDVLGNVKKTDVKLTIATVQDAGQTETVGKATITINPKGEFSIDLGTVLEGIEPSVVVNTAANNFTITVDSENFFALSDMTPVNGQYSVAVQKVDFVKVKEDGEEKDIDGDYSVANKAKVTLKYDASLNDDRQPKVPYVTGAAKASELYGNFAMKLNFRDAANNVLKTIEFPAEVKAQSFDDYFKKNEYAAWSGNTLNMILEDGAINLGQAEINKLFTDMKGNPLTSEPLNFADQNSTTDGDQAVKYVWYNAAGTGITAWKADFNEILSTDNHTLATLKMTDGNAVSALSQLAVDSYTTYVSANGVKVMFMGETLAAGQTTHTAKDVAVTSSFTVKATPAFSGAKLVYYVNNVAQETALVDVNGFIKPLEVTPATDATAEKKNGLALVLGDFEIPVGGNNTENGKLFFGNKLGAFEIWNGTTGTTPTVNCALAQGSNKADSAGKIRVYYAQTANSAGTISVATNTDRDNKSELKIELTANESGELVFYFADHKGITTSASIKYKKQ